MNKKSNKFFSCLIGLLIFQPLMGQKIISKSEIFLDSVMVKEHIPGLAYAIIRNGEIQKSGIMGKANLQWNTDVTTQTVFQLASCSKIFCALLLGKLFDNAILRPGETLSEIMDSIPDSWKNITILQLAAHQSGIKIEDFSNAKTSRQALEIARRAGMDYEPGTRSAYVSSDYWVLLYVIEKITGMKYYNALKKYVLTPLNLEHTFVSNLDVDYTTTSDIIPQQAQEYHWWKNDTTLRISEFNFYPTSYGAGGIYSSISDLAKIAEVFDKGDFISKNTRQLITNPVYLKDGKAGEFGLGLVNRNYQGHHIVEHSGGPALADFVRFEEEKLTFIVLTNNRGLYPYLSKALATFYINNLSMPAIPEDWE